MEKREPSYHVGGNVDWYKHCGEHYGGSLKKQRYNMIQGNSTPGHISWENHNSEMDKHHGVHYSTIYNSQDMEKTKMSPDRSKNG